MKAPPPPPWPQPWTMTETRHVWVPFHQRYDSDHLIVIDLMSIEAVVQDEQHSIVHTGLHDYYRVYESVEQVMAAMHKHLGGKVT